MRVYHSSMFIPFSDVDQHGRVFELSSNAISLEPCPDLTPPLWITKFSYPFSKYKNIMLKAYPDRRAEV